jgi:hypothetical protein
MEAACSSEMSMNYYQITWNAISEAITLNTLIFHCFHLLVFISVLNEVQNPAIVEKWGPQGKISVWGAWQQIQGFEKIMETLQILYTSLFYYYGVGPPFVFNTATILLRINSHKFRTVSSGILYQSS